MSSEYGALYTMGGSVREPHPLAGNKKGLSEILLAAAPASAAGALQNNPRMLKQFGMTITEGIDSQHFKKQDAQDFGSSKEAYVDKLVNVAGSGIFGPKVAAAGKAVKAVSELANTLKSFDRTTKSAEANLSQEMQANAFDHEIPKTIPRSIDEVAGFKPPSI